MSLRVNPNAKFGDMLALLITAGENQIGRESHRPEYKTVPLVRTAGLSWVRCGWLATMRLLRIRVKQRRKKMRLREPSGQTDLLQCIPATL